MKFRPRTLIAPLLAILFALFLIFIDGNTGKDYKAKLKLKYVNVFINKTINGVVTKVYRTDIENILRGEFARRSVQVNYTDNRTGSISNVDTKLEYEDHINVGDSISKREGERMFRIKKKNGDVQILTID